MSLCRVWLQPVDSVPIPVIIESRASDSFVMESCDVCLLVGPLVKGRLTWSWCPQVLSRRTVITRLTASMSLAVFRYTAPKIASMVVARVLSDPLPMCPGFKRTCRSMPAGHAVVARLALLPMVETKLLPCPV
jgi:hypothetical protein